jgi:hypothetical protein
MTLENRLLDLEEQFWKGDADRYCENLNDAAVHGLRTADRRRRLGDAPPSADPERRRLSHRAPGSWRSREAFRPVL